MLRLTLIIVWGLLFSVMVQAQPTYGNEWIDYEQTYYKFEISLNGVYRIAYETLEEAGLPLTGTDFQLFTAGKQVPIFVKTDGTFSEGDYIEFYGTPNDGEFDTQLFLQEQHQLNKDNSLFYGKRVYFLTSTSDGEHLRYESVTSDLPESLPPPDPFFYYESKVNQNFFFHTGEPFYTTPTLGFLGHFSKGEGWCSSIVQENAPYTLKVPTEYLYPDATDEDEIKVKTRVVGRNHSVGVINDKHVQIKINDNPYVDETFSRYDIVNYRFNLRPSELNLEPDFNGDIFTRLVYNALDGEFGGFPFNTRYSVVYASVNYPRLFNFENKSLFHFTLDVNAEKYIEIENFNTGNGEVILYDLTTNQRRLIQVEDTLVKIHLYPNFDIDSKRNLFLTNTDNAVFEVASLTPRQFIDLNDLDRQGNFLMIYHDSLTKATPDPVKRYESYRTSEEGGSYQVTSVEINELIDQFAWGIDEHPLSIRNFVNYAIDHWEMEPTYLLLLGKSVMYDDVRFQTTNRQTSLVPSFGTTPSDNLLSSRHWNDYRPQLATGRLSAQHGDQINAYLDKLIEYETLNREVDCTFEARNWMKGILHVSKGWGDNETDYFSDNLEDYVPIFESAPAGMFLLDTLRDTHGPPGGGDTTGFDPAPAFTEAMNNGFALINYFGHGIGNWWQYDINTNPEYYDNTGRYPFFLSNACSVGQIHQESGSETMVEDYVLVEDGGAIAFLASTALSSAYMVDIFSEKMLYNMMDTLYDASIAQNIQKTIFDLYDMDNESVRKVCTEFTFMGDPAVSMYHWDRPEYILADFNIQEDSLLYESEGFAIDFVVQNMGRALTDSFEVNLLQTAPDGSIYEAWTTLLPSTLYLDTFSLNVPLEDSLRILGDHIFTLQINPDTLIAEDCKNNNTWEKSLFIFDCEPNCVMDTMVMDTMDVDTMVIDTMMTDTTIMNALQYTQWELKQIKIYPNPNKGIFAIEAGDAIIREVEIYNAEGQKVFSKKGINEPTLTIDLKDQPKGNYMIRISTNRSVIVKSVTVF